MSAEQIIDTLKDYPSEKLLTKSREWMEDDTLTHQTVAALTVVSNRYLQSRSDTAERRNAMRALQMLGNLYMVRLIDYNKAYKSLWEARQIAEELGDDASLAAIYGSLANLYCVSPGDPARKDLKVEESLRKAAEAAIKCNDMEHLPMIAMNIAVWSFPRKTWSNLEPTVQEIKRIYKNDPKFKVVFQVMDACNNYFRGNSGKAEELLFTARKGLRVKRFAERYYYSIDLILADLYLDTKQYDKGIDLMLADMKLAAEKDHTDFLISIYEELSRLYEGAGDRTKADEYQIKFLKLKNEFEKKTGLANLEGLEFLSQIDTINAQVEKLSVERRESERQKIIIISILGVVLVMLLALIWVYVNLKRTHRNLFERHTEMLKREEQHRLLREQWEEERRALMAKNGELPDLDKPSEPAAETESGEEEDEENLVNLKKVYTKILMILEESRDIYNLGFSIADLAEMAGKSVREISKAINVCYGGNFHQLLNKYRIREAARLMHNCSRSTYTIEGTAEKSGFKSRTSFATLFKKIIGITPSEYWRLARENESDSVPLPE